MHSFSFRRTSRGIASLPAILLFGGIIIEIGIAGAFLLFYLNTNIYGARLTNEASLAAQSGIDDAVLRLTLNNTWAGESYSLAVGSRSVDVTVCKATCPASSPVGIGKYYITSTGNALTRRSRLVSIVSVDDITGLVSIDSIKEEVE